MARADILDILQYKNSDKTALNFDWNSLTAPPMLSLLSMYDVKLLEDISRDPRLNSKLREKREYIDQILKPRGFARFASGTNRIVYKFLEDQSFLIKMAISEAGINDSPAEYKNQFKLMPYVSKCFEVSPRGSLGLFERVFPISSKQQYYSVADEIFDMIDSFIGKLILADIGTNFFMNIGIRKGFGPVFIDYPLVFELDGEKLFCNSPDQFTGLPCGGPIDYDNGLNFLYCKKCGKQYLASKLAKGEYTNSIVFKGRKEVSKMKIKILKDDEIIKVSDSIVSSDSYVKDIRIKNEQLKKAVEEDAKEAERIESLAEQEKPHDLEYTPNDESEVEEVEEAEEEIKVPKIMATKRINVSEYSPITETIGIKNEEEPVIPITVTEKKEEKIKAPFPDMKLTNMQMNVEDDEVSDSIKSELESNY